MKLKVKFISCYLIQLHRVQVNIPIVKTKEDLSELRGAITCDKPNSNLYEYKGKIFIDNKEM